MAGFVPKKMGPAVLSGRQAAVSNGGVVVRMGAMAVYRPPCGEAQTAAGVRSSRFLPKTARRCNWRAHFGQTGLRAYSRSPCTPPWQVFSRPAALKNLAIQQVFLRFFALQDVKIPANSAHREILDRL